MAKKQKTKNKKRKRSRCFFIFGKKLILLMICIGFCISIYSVVNKQNSLDFLSSNDILYSGHKNRQNKIDVLMGENIKKDLVNTEIPVILQNPELPSGCESAAAVMLLGAYGYDVDKEDFACALPWYELEQYNGKTYCCNPEEAFAGSPYSTGYGVFSDIVAKTIQKFINQQGGNARAKDISGSSEEDILKYIENKTPVCIWVTMELQEVTYKKGWYIKKANHYTDEYFEWPSGEHCMVLTGYDQDNVYVHDPLKGKTEYKRSIFFQRYEDMGRQAIVILDME